MNRSQPDYSHCNPRKTRVSITKGVSKDLISKKLQVEKRDESLNVFKKILDGQKLQSFNQERRQLYLKVHPGLLAKRR